MKYKILFDYGMEGNSIDDNEYETVDDAIRGAVSMNYCTKFRTISIHWEPTPTNTDKQPTP